MTARIDALGLGPVEGYGVRNLVVGGWRLLRADGRRVLAALAPFLLAQALLAGILAVNEVRAAADSLETLVDDAAWPLPTYQEMLFAR